MKIEKKANWKKISLKKNDLQGKWLMVGRVRNGNEQRRNLDRPRKTMKFLINGYFQWIAFNTEKILLNISNNLKVFLRMLITDF